MTITMLPIDGLHESPFNYRKSHDEASLAELAADIKAHGRVLSPLLVRPRIPPMFAGDPDAATGHEIVFGHRRFRAAQLAGLTELPCMVQGMSDEEAKKAQISENLQRVDVHPIEEAEGFQALIDDHGMTADLIAEQHGKSRSYVYGRLKLLQACPQIRKACLAGEIGSEVALLISRLRTDKLQEKALGYIKGKFYDLEDGGARSFRSIRDLLNERFTLELKSAMFDIEDEMLLPTAGNCVTCPKRSGNAPEFVDVVEGKKPNAYCGQHYGADVCTDPDCFDDKKKAHLKREASKLEQAGKAVIQGAKARQAIDACGNVKGGYIKLADVKEALKKAGKDAKPDVFSLQDPRTGKVHQVVKEEDLPKGAVKGKGKASGGGSGRNWEAENKRNEQLAEAKTTRNKLLLTRVHQAAAAAPRSSADLSILLEYTLEMLNWEDEELIAELWGIESVKEFRERAMAMPPEQQALLLLDCAISHEIEATRWHLDKEPKHLLAAAEAYSVDVKALDDELRPPVEQPSTPSSAARAPKKAKAAQALKKAKSKAQATEEKEEIQKDDAGFAGEGRAEANLEAADA